jgi:signal transduction histidine kinase
MTDSSPSNWPSRLEWLLILGAWTTVALLTAANAVLAPRGGGGIDWSQFPSALGMELFEYGFWILVTPLVFWLVRALPLDRPHITRNVVLHLGIAVVASFSVDITDILIRRAVFDVPERLAEFNVLHIITQLWFVNELIVYFVILAAGFARDYYLQKKRRQEEAERLQERATALEQQLTEARLEALRMQLNPHFLFNTLHAVSTLVDRDPNGVRRMITRLSELLRHVLDEEAPQEVPLAQELEFLDDYFEIQSIRFQGRLDTEVDVHPSLHDAQVPNLLLQPVVENAIKHGASQVRGVGRIEIRGRREGDDLVLSVTDNGPGLPEAQEDGLGLRNVRARLRELYGDDHTLRLDSADGGGTRAVVKLPYHTSVSLYTASGAPTLTTATPEADAQ